MRIERRRFLKNSSRVLLATGVTAVAGHHWVSRVETERLQVSHVRVPLQALPTALEGLRIVQLSDFHLYPHTRLEFVRQVVETARKLRPDLVVLTGDFVQRRAEAIFDLAPTLAQLNPRLGSWAVMGNHDYWQGPAIVRQGLEEAGIPLLVNQGVTLIQNGHPFYLAGIDDAWSGRPDLKKTLDGRPEGCLAILLSHEPDPADDYCRDPRVALQLSGHSHGGQVRFPLLGSPFLPPLGRKYDRGLYRVGTSWLYTNCGIGVTAPIRFNCPPEVTELTLSSGEV